MKLLIIRPEPGASESAKRAQAAGFEPLLLPFFRMRAVQWSVPDQGQHDALLLTSANAVRHAGDGLDALRMLPAHCVGQRTGEAARAAGLRVASVGTTDAVEAAKAAANAGHCRPLWLAGQDRGIFDFPSNIAVTTVPCYAAEAIALLPKARTIIAAAGAVALHSPRAAESFAAAIEAMGLERSTIYVAAFSPAIAQAAGRGWRGVAVAAKPTDSDLLSALTEVVKRAGNKDAGKDII
jgi:uroporphyrinogen-III synthase